MDGISSIIALLLAAALLWSSGAKLLPSARLAESPEMSWAKRPGLVSGTIAGIVELIAGALLLASAFVSMDVVVLLVGAGIAAHMVVASSKAEGDVESDQGSRVPNLVIAAMGLLVALLVFID